MITKMKKITFLVYHKDYEEFLKNLRGLGMIHVQMKQSGMPDDPKLKDNINLSSELSKSIRFLNSLKVESVDLDKPGNAEKGFVVHEDINKKKDLLDELNQNTQTLEREIFNQEMWGNYNPTDLKKLKEDTGFETQFFTCTANQFQSEWIDDYNAIIINTLGSRLYFITLTKDDVEVTIDVERVRAPKRSLSELQENLQAIEEERDKIKQELNQFAAEDIPSLKAAIQELHSNIEFSKVLLNTEHTVENHLMVLQGWLPEEREQEVSEYLNREQAYYEIVDPTPDDNVPIKLTNNRFAKLFEPILELYMLPKYNELDLTPFFAPFFMIFFGLCLGDSGYGLFLVVAAALFKVFVKEIKPQVKTILSLLQILGASTFFCGLLSGSFFGVSLYELDWPIAQKLKALVALDHSQMFQLALILGVIQIMFGKILEIVNKTIQFGFKYAISTLGWVLLLLSIIFAYLFPKVLPMGGTVHIILLVICGLAICLYNSPGKNIFLNIGLSLWDTYNMATGLLGDILSYIRLFALGLSGGILASVFNSLAVGMSPDNVVLGPIVMVLIFVVGHTINIFMNTLGAIVHPMRLTFVEFFKNSGFEGGGVAYQPFKK
ncbi:MAG: V-type ATP synthase subunit I [Bacteroidales bacterium]|nr:V-type ATP synthase subunit I [Bacteroidales bacterium]